MIKKTIGKLKRRIELYQAIYRDKRTPRLARWFIWLAVVYALMPFDLIPDFIPVLGHLDDIIIVPFLLYLAYKMTPREIYQEHYQRIYQKYSIKTGGTKMNETDYPSLFQSSDKASIALQKCYIKAIRTDFALLVIIAASSVFFFEGYKYLVISFLLLSFVLKLVVQAKKWDKKWFVTRAVAESVKTITWRYMMGSEPYNLALSPAEVDKQFINKLDEIIKTNSEAQKCWATCLSGNQQISDQMRKIRAMNLSDKKEIYLKDRVEEQRKWYENKAKSNGEAENKWFWAVIILEFIAVLFLIFTINSPKNFPNPVGVVTTLAAVFAAWNQIKRHGELSQSYSVASQELSSAKSIISYVNSVDELGKYAESTENSISREHTMWCAKRS